MKTKHRFWQLTVFFFLLVLCVLHAVEVRGDDDIRLVSITTDGPDRIATGSTARYTCTAKWSDGTTATVTPTWSVSAPNYNPTYGTVNSSGVVTNQNSTTEDQGIFVNARYTSNGVTVTASGTKTGKYVILEKKALRSIAINGPASVATGNTAAYTCTATWSYGSSSTLTSNLTWSLNSTEHASVISTAGVVTNKNATTSDQMATLNARCTLNGVTKTAAKSIMLDRKLLTEIFINGPDTVESSSMDIPGTATYTCMATWSYGSDTTVEPTWSVTPTTYASVDTTGTVTNKNTTETDQTVTLNASYTIDDMTMTASKDNITLAALLPSYTLTVIGGSGGGVYKVGTDVTVTADEADDDYVFSSWIAEGVALDDDQLATNPLTITMPNGDVTLTATYASEYTYTVSDGKATITGYTGFKTDLMIPSAIDGYPVVAIENDAFSGQMIMSVIIPEGVTSIGSYAFNWCWNLATVFIPASVTSIGINPFYGNMSLASIDVDTANACYASVDGVLFNKSRSTLLRYPPAKEDAEYAIPSFVATIESDAFESCNNLISMTIPEGVASIGYEAFSQCYNLTSVTIPGSVASIENYTFYFCNNLSFLTIPEGVTSIGTGAFYYCSSLTSVTIPSSVTSIGDQAFYDCSNLTEMDFSGEPPTFAEDAYPTPITFYAQAGHGWEEWTVPSGVTLVILEPSLESITVSGDATIATAGTATYTCSAAWSDGTITTVTPTWTLSSTAYASVDAEGVVTNKNTTTTDQTVKLTATYTAGEVTCESSKIITLEGVEESATQILDLEPGWNWVGFNVLPTNRTVDNVLGTAFYKVNDIIQTNGGSARFTGTSWTPASFTIEYGKLYQIYMGRNIQIRRTLYGVADGPSSLPLAAGWNWIANSTLEDVTPSQLTHSGGWSENDRIQTAGGNGAAYINGKWIPAGFTLESGKGYQIFAANEGTLTFPIELYVVVDLSGGPYAASYPVRYTNTPPNLDDDTCRTTELWLRKIPAGTFIMGSPEDELGRRDGEENMAQHQVTLTQDYYIGVFECTQRQWELVMGDKPSWFNNATYYATRPVEQLSYNMIRGTGAQAGAGWPTYGHAVDASSFMGKLQAKTGLVFDLPTEAQWEYACRAGTTTALNSGKNLTSIEQDVAMDEVGRYLYNGGSVNLQNCSPIYATAKVGSYRPNAWGLYDMHGNVWESCLDWWGGNTSSTAAATDSVGPTTGSYRVIRGGGWNNGANYSRSASRSNNSSPSACYDNIGFRVALHPKEDLYAVVDLSGGPDAASYPVRYTDAAPNLYGDTCRTTELWLRRIPAGTFIMGSLEDEVGRTSNDMAQHEVTLTQVFYIGVFECTQKQWELVMGSNPSLYKGDCRPVEQVSYNMIRGTGAQAGAGWPAYGHEVDAVSFMGKLQAKTGLTFDLPTEAQWEYACRAGTTTALNSGKNLTSASDADMAEIGRYSCNQSDGKGGYSEHTTVGSYLPNAWGLYDMHGNVCEWCLDWYGASTTSTEVQTDPVGPDTGSRRVERGGVWYNYADFCRSASRGNYSPSNNNFSFGCRVLCLP